MIVCHCHRITDTEIKRHIKCGAKTLNDIKGCCSACTNCEGCEEAILEILRDKDDIAAKAEESPGSKVQDAG